MNKARTLLKLYQNHFPMTEAERVQMEPNYPDVHVGDRVEWRHQRSTLRGVVEEFVEEGLENSKPEGIAARRWRESKAWIGIRRAVVKVEQAEGSLPVYYVVGLQRLTRNQFRVIK